MPTTKQAEKRLRQNEKKRLHNKHLKSSCKSQTKKVLAAVEAGDAELARKELSLATKKLYKAAKLNIYHKNTVARKVSKLAKEVEKISQKG